MVAQPSGSPAHDVDVIMKRRCKDAAPQSVPSGASAPSEAQPAGPRRSTDAIDVFPPSPSRLLRTSSDAPPSERRTSRATHTSADAKMVSHCALPSSVFVYSGCATVGTWKSRQEESSQSRKTAGSMLRRGLIPSDSSLSHQLCGSVATKRAGWWGRNRLRLTAVCRRSTSAFASAPCIPAAFGFTVKAIRL